MKLFQDLEQLAQNLFQNTNIDEYQINDKEKDFTWFSRKNHSIGSSIDYILI